jgi:hypothetical protein
VRAARPHAAAMGEGFRGFAQSWYLEQPNWQLLEMSYAVSVSLLDKIRIKIRLLSFTTLPGRYTTHDATRFRDAWAPHTQTQRHGELAMMNTPL